MTVPEVVLVRSAETEVRRRKRPRKVASERASGHYAATMASLSTVCNVTCLRGLAEASLMLSRDNIVRRALLSARLHQACARADQSGSAALIDDRLRKRIEQTRQLVEKEA